MKKIISINSIKNSKKTQKYLMASCVLILLFSLLYFFTDTLRCRNCVYSDNEIKIRKADLDNALAKNLKFYQYKNQKVDEDLLKKDAVEVLKSEQKILNYADEKNISVSKEEVNELYQERIKQNQSEDNLLKLVRDMYGLNKNSYLEVLENDILREKVQKDLNMPLAEWLNQ